MDKNSELYRLRTARKDERRKMLQILGDKYDDFWNDDKELHVLIACLVNLKKLDEKRNLSYLTLSVLIFGKLIDIKPLANKHPSEVIEVVNKTIESLLEKREEQFKQHPGLKEAFESYHEIQAREVKLQIPH